MTQSASTLPRVEMVQSAQAVGTISKDEMDVFLNVYDMVRYNQYAYWLGVGIYHSGVEIAGKEYAFGGHCYNTTGVFCMRPKQALNGVIFRNSFYMGRCRLSPNQAQETIRRISKEFIGCSYSILQRNCNHFSNDLVFQLCGRSIPSWVNRLAYFGTLFPCIVPREWLHPPEAQENLLVESTSLNTCDFPTATIHFNNKTTQDMCSSQQANVFLPTDSLLGTDSLQCISVSEPACERRGVSVSFEEHPLSTSTHTRTYRAVSQWMKKASQTASLLTKKHKHTSTHPPSRLRDSSVEESSPFIPPVPSYEPDASLPSIPPQKTVEFSPL